MQRYSTRPATQQRGEHTEGPCWDARSARLLWVDQYAGLVNVAEWDGRQLNVLRTFRLGSAVGAVVPTRAAQGWLAACAQGFAALDADGTLTPLAQPEAANPVPTRMNDGKCDPLGRFWAGSIAWDKRTGAASLYRLEHDYAVTTVLRGVTISNGLAWPDEATLYYIDTPTRGVDRFRITPEGRVVDRTTVVRIEDGQPDGMCIDDEGCLWVAVWGGSAVHRYAPDGTLLATAEVDAPQVSSCCLGGRDGRTLFVTTSCEGMDEAARAEHPNSGHLFFVEVACLGETMALVAPDPPVPLSIATTLLLSHAGAESNVAIGLARLGTPTAFVTRFGDDPFGHRIATEIAATGVDVSAVRVVAGERTGVMFKDPRPDVTRVRYYRDGSAAAALDGSDVERALAFGPRALHLTGVTPALSDSCARAIDTAVTEAAARGTAVSFDVNYRPALWRDRETAADALLAIAQRCHTVLVGLDEAEALWSCPDDDAVRAVLDRPAVLVVKDGSRAATAFVGQVRESVPALPVEVLEAVGAGDAFAAGWLHARLQGLDAAAALRLGHLSAARVLRSATDHDPQALPPGALSSLARDAAFWPPADWQTIAEGRP